jgi:uncharacterized protein with GYD domain
MPYFLLQVAYTPVAWAAMLKKPHTHLEDLRPWLAQLGGKLESCWLAFGEYDALLICQLPDHTSAAALSMAASAGGTVKTIKITPLMSVEESFNALAKAAGTHEHSSGSSSISGLPVPRSREVDYRQTLSSRLHNFKRRMEKMVTGRS